MERFQVAKSVGLTLRVPTLTTRYSVLRRTNDRFGYPNSEVYLGLLYQLQRRGMTVVLTTHYLDEADEADQIYIVDHGGSDCSGSALDIKSQYAKTS